MLAMRRQWTVAPNGRKAPAFDSPWDLVHTFEAALAAQIRAGGAAPRQSRWLAATAELSVRVASALDVELGVHGGGGGERTRWSLAEHASNATRNCEEALARSGWMVTAASDAQHPAKLVQAAASEPLSVESDGLDRACLKVLQISHRVSRNYTGMGWWASLAAEAEFGAAVPAKQWPRPADGARGSGVNPAKIAHDVEQLQYLRAHWTPGHMAMAERYEAGLRVLELALPSDTEAAACTAARSAGEEDRWWCHVRHHDGSLRPATGGAPLERMPLSATVCGR
jgi:hypothetical protein